MNHPERHQRVGHARQPGMWCIRCAVVVVSGDPRQVSSHRCDGAYANGGSPVQCSHCAQLGRSCIGVSNTGIINQTLATKLITAVTWVMINDSPSTAVPTGLAQQGFMDSRREANLQLQHVLATERGIPTAILNMLDPPEPANSRVATPVTINTRDEEGMPSGFYPTSGVWLQTSDLPSGWDSDDSRVSWDSQSGMPIFKRD